MPLPPYGEGMPSRIDARTLGLVVVGGMVGVAARATLVVPLAYLALGNQPAALLTGVLTLIVYVKHRPNIERLLKGTEGKIGAKG